MSKLSTLFRAFVGDAESAVSMVADALSAAVKTAAQHGTQAPLADALSTVDSIKGNARRVLALREGIKATGVTVTDGRVTIPGVTIGKTTAADAAAVAGEVSATFTLAAGVILSAAPVKATRSADDIAAGAIKALATLSATTAGEKAIARALKGDTGADVLATIARIIAADAAAVAVEKAAARKTAAPVTAAPAAPVTTAA